MCRGKDIVDFGTVVLFCVSQQKVESTRGLNKSGKESIEWGRLLDRSPSMKNLEMERGGSKGGVKEDKSSGVKNGVW